VCVCVCVCMYVCMYVRTSCVQMKAEDNKSLCVLQICSVVFMLSIRDLVKAVSLSHVRENKCDVCLSKINGICRLIFV
jgi:hypothetical protein